MSRHVVYNATFLIYRGQISHLQAPTLVEHTLNDTSLKLVWLESNFINEDYKLQCRNVDKSNAWQFCHNQTWLNYTFVSVQSLQPYTKYQVLARVASFLIFLQ